MGKHVSAKAHLLYIEVPKGSETSLLPPERSLRLKGSQQSCPNVKYTLARLFEEAAPLREWRYTYIRPYTPREDPNPVRYPGDTRKHCTAPTIRCYKFGAEAIVVPLAPGIGGWRPRGTKCTRATGSCGDIQHPPQTDPSVWDDSSTDCMYAWLVVEALGTGCMEIGDQQCAQEPADLKAEGQLWLAGTPVNAQQLRLLDKNLRHEVKAAEKLDHKRRKLVQKQREKDELVAAKKSLQENGVKAAVEHKQGSQHQRLLDSPFHTTSTPENRC